MKFWKIQLLGRQPNARKETCMKKTILAVLMVVLVATPCFAQEVESDEILTLEGTFWQRV